MTGAVYDILLQLALHYRSRGRSVKEASWNLIQRMQRTVVQALDFLPPVDVTFHDYALAMVRAHELADPRDPHGYRDRIIQAFAKREILSKDEADQLKTDGYGYLHNRLHLDVFHSVLQIAKSKADAYRFLDDNRDALDLPKNRDLEVADLYSAEKAARQGLRMPRQTILEYVWREDVLLEENPLEEPRFGRFAGEWTTLLCGGTLVFDENSTILWWARKPGDAERRNRFLDDLARKIRRGQIGSELGGEQGLVGAAMAPFVERRVDGALRIDLAPHFGIADGEEEEGEWPWAISF